MCVHLAARRRDRARRADGKCDGGSAPRVCDASEWEASAECEDIAWASAEIAKYNSRGLQLLRTMLEICEPPQSARRALGLSPPCSCGCSRWRSTRARRSPPDATAVVQQHGARSLQDRNPSRDDSAGPSLKLGCHRRCRSMSTEGYEGHHDYEMHVTVVSPWEEGTIINSTCRLRAGSGRPLARHRKLRPRQLGDEFSRASWGLGRPRTARDPPGSHKLEFYLHTRYHFSTNLVVAGLTCTNAPPPSPPLPPPPPPPSPRPPAAARHRRRGRRLGDVVLVLLGLGVVVIGGCCCFRPAWSAPSFGCRVGSGGCRRGDARHSARPDVERRAAGQADDDGSDDDEGTRRQRDGGRPRPDDRRAQRWAAPRPQGSHRCAARLAMLTRLLVAGTVHAVHIDSAGHESWADVSQAVHEACEDAELPSCRCTA